YCRWLATPVPEADAVEAYRANVLFDARADDPEFGYRYLADEAEAASEPFAVCTAWRLCLANAWFSVCGKARAKNGNCPARPVNDDLCVVTDTEGRTRLGSEPLARTDCGSPISRCMEATFGSTCVTKWCVTSRHRGHWTSPFQKQPVSELCAHLPLRARTLLSVARKPQT